MATIEERAKILRKAASRTLLEVILLWVTQGDSCNLQLYVFESGTTLIEFPQYVVNYNPAPFASAPIGNYANVEALVAALGESVADEEPTPDCTSIGPCDKCGRGTGGKPSSSTFVRRADGLYFL
jgi:hypothetical protein